jgi:Bacteriocin-protection, YdeI or OmpD-Associated/Domain of unknown function (DUF1905)
LQPWRTEDFKISPDPLLIDKIRDVAGLYLAPPANAVVFAVDEKPQIQALERTAPVLPMIPGVPERRSHDYVSVIDAGPGDSAVIAMPFDPDEAWGAKADHPVGGSIDGRRIRARLVPPGRGWVLTLAPKRLHGMGVAIGDEVTVELAPEGPQRGDLADDIAAALAANPAAGAFFDTLAQFYRKAYLRWIDATTRRPGLRAARIAEVTGLLAARIKERPRS